MNAITRFRTGPSAQTGALSDKGSVGIACTSIGGMEALSFLWSEPPMPDESLMGHLARIAADNAHVDMCQALARSGYVTKKPNSLPTHHHDQAKRIAHLLKVDEGEVRERMIGGRHAAARAVKIDWFGATFRGDYRDPETRRVSPLALREKPYHRSVWEIRIFGFCPDSREKLLERCPVCTRKQGWNRARGIFMCDYCVDGRGNANVDLREFPQPIIDVADDEALRFVTDLISPLTERQERAVALLPEPLRSMPRGDIFEMIVSITSALRPVPSGKRLTGVDRPASHDEMSALSPDSLARAGRVAMSWPKGWHDLLDESRSSNLDNAWLTGFKAELGALYHVHRDRSVPPPLQSLLRTEMDVNHTAQEGDERLMRRGLTKVRPDLMTTKEVADYLGVYRAAVPTLINSPDIQTLHPEGAKKHIRLFRRDQIEAVKAMRDDLMRPDWASNRLGVPEGMLPWFVNEELIAEGSGPALLLTKAGGYRRSSIEALELSLEAMAHDPLPGCKSLLDWAKTARGPVDWTKVMTDARGSLFRLFWIKPDATSITRRFGVASDTAVDPYRMQGDLLASAIPEAMTFKEAGQCLGVSDTHINYLIKNGFLEPSGSGYRQITKADLDRFKARYALNAEVAAAFGCTLHAVRSAMRQRGFGSAPASAGGKKHVWFRADFEAALAKR
jgi:DNA-binding transcriptional MerR regulator